MFFENDSDSSEYEKLNEVLNNIVHTRVEREVIGINCYSKIVNVEYTYNQF